MDDLGAGGTAYSWRDTVEHRLGGLSRAAQVSERERGELREDLKAVTGKLDTWGHHLTTQLQQQFGSLRAELRTEHATRSEHRPLDWKLVALISAVAAGALVGIGVVIGRETTPHDAAVQATGAITP